MAPYPARVVLVALVVAAAGARAVTLPAVFADGMVLQRAPQTAQIWGWAAGGAQLDIVGQLDATGQTAFSARAVAHAATGEWAARLPPTVQGGPYTIFVSEPNEVTVVLRDVLFGDVWLCSGQSNMEMTVGMVYDAEEEIADAANWPNVRLFSVRQNAQATPVQNVTYRSSVPWSRSSPAAVGGGPYDYFSASCYFFGRELNRLTGVPQGLVASSWGGTRIQAWMSLDALRQCGLASDAERVVSSPKVFEYVPVEQRAQLTADPNDASALWNGMIVPIQKMSFVGATWYQGESNAGEPALYACMFPAMIEDWRSKLQSDLYFYYVQLAPYQSGGYLPAIREAQRAALALPNTGEAVVIETWDPQCPWGEIHPRGKQQVGVRMALHALVQLYGFAVDPFGPVVQSAAQSGSTVRVEFKTSQINFRGTDYCSSCCSTVAFEVRNAVTQTWVRASSASVVGTTTVTLTVPARVTTVDRVRYAWEDIPQCLVVDAALLPAGHFDIAVTRA